MMSIDGQVIVERATEYGVQFGADGPVMLCEDQNDAEITALMDTRGHVVKSEVFRTAWEACLS